MHVHLFDEPRFYSTSVIRVCLAAALLGLTLAAPGDAGQKQKKPPGKSKSAPAAKPAEAAVPFHAGETLDYQILWSQFSVNAATARLSVPERRPFFGQQAWHFQAVAHTIDTTRLLFSLDDQFDSYSEPAALVGLQFEMYLHEQGKQQASVLRLSAAGDPAPGNATMVRVLPGTRDAIGFLYYLRTVDWQRTPEVHGPVFDGRNLYEVKARLDLPRGEVTVPAGHFVASRIAVRVFERGRELPQTTFRAWLAQDAARTPVLLEVEVPFGTGRIELTHAQ